MRAARQASRLFLTTSGYYRNGASVMLFPSHMREPKILHERDLQLLVVNYHPQKTTMIEKAASQDYSACCCAGQWQRYHAGHPECAAILCP